MVHGVVNTMSRTSLTGGKLSLRRTALGAGIFLALFAAAACRAEPPAALPGCAACHGADGVSTLPKTPHLNGQLVAFIADSLRAFADGGRPTSVAAHRTVAADQIEALAQHYASQKSGGRPRQEIDAEVLGRGAAIYDKRCFDCHLDAGRDSKDGAPLLAGQNKEFLIEQTLSFKSGARKFPYMMDGAYQRLTEEELAAVASYFAAQEPASAAPPNKKRRR